MFESIAQHAPDAIVVVDGEGRVVWANTRAHALTGRSTLVGTHIDSFVPEARRAAHEGHRRAYLETPRTRPMDGGRVLSLRGDDGSELPVQIALAPMAHEGATRFVVTLRDARPTIALEAERAMLARERELTERVATLALISASLAHEINNPLVVVRSSLELLSESHLVNLDSRNELLIREALHAVLRISDVVGELQRANRPVDVPPDRVDLAAVIESATLIARPALQHADASVRAELSEARWVRARETPLVQVMANLLVNAAHAVHGADDRTIRVYARPEGDARVLVTVRDRGAGIDARHRDRVFEPLFTTDARGVGTGIGLPLCRSILRALGGEIALGPCGDDALGDGTCLEVRLPRESAG